MVTPERRLVPIGLADRFPLSYNQESLCLLDEGDDEGPFGPRATIARGWRVRGRVNTGILQDTLDELVIRHESLRSAIVRDDDRPPYQQVLPPTPTELVELDLSDATTEPDRDRRIEELLADVESGSYNVVHPPLLMAVLGRFTDEDSVLVLIAHHTAADDWSVRLLLHDLAVGYAARRGFLMPAWGPVPQYREFVAWERARARTPETLAAREYWRHQLANSAPSAPRADYPRSANLRKNTSVYRFIVDRQRTAAVTELATATRSSPFMVYLAAFELFLHERTGATDLTVPTLTSGRGPARFHETVGSFFNVVPLRTNLAGATTFRDVVARTRRTCLAAYAHDIPFALVLADVPRIGLPFTADDLAVIVFGVFQFQAAISDELVGDLTYSDIRGRPMSQAVRTDFPDGALFQLEIDPSGDTVGTMAFGSNRYDVATIAEMVAHFDQVLARTVLAPDRPLTLISHAGGLT